ncbi:NAD-dependent epimerase/dehydratase family protein [Kitasatospora mediocidica]|uniref:NAD-dependent epimerase/dehydratase family protein n=1 Tax=Kitasatospora mediocidica TaxID=58352 RepID=UPI00055EF84D|nr:NAD-dependent epimerase/dehydratase family protein [Kitasatospora mediocidica]
MRVLVTGAAGYIGGAVVRQLLENGDQVVALVHATEAVFPTGVEVRRGDVTDADFVREAAADADGVCHLAALARVRSHAATPTRYFRLNVGGTVNVLDAMADRTRRTGHPGSLVLASTSAVYGDRARQPISEQSPEVFANPYADSKIACEHAVRWQAETGALGSTALRIFNAAGAYAGRGDRDASRILPRAVNVAVNGAAGGDGQLHINGTGGAVRDFVHVLDVARAFVLALHSNRPGHARTYNLGGTPASVADIVETVERVTGRRVPRLHGPELPGEAPVLTADTTEIRTDLGWEPARAALEDIVFDQWVATTAAV